MNPREAALLRLQYERSMGLDFVPRVAYAPPARVSAVPAAPQAAATTAATPNLQPSAPASVSAAVVKVPPVPVAPAISAADKEARWKALEARAMACVKCDLHKGRQHVVFGTGDRNARLMFVGEGPGADEDAQGIPFVGRAGQFLDKIIAAMKLKREEVYICNVVKCRPPENRTPMPTEISTCMPYLLEQIELVAPKVIVALGKPAAQTLFNDPQLSITRARGKWGAFRGIPVMPTFHPAFVLRAYTEENRRAVWDDMKQVMERLKS